MNWLIVFFVLVLSVASYGEESVSKYEDHGKRDPFWRLVSPSGAILSLDNDLSATDMVLEGVIQDQTGKNLAIINSVVVAPGDKIGLFEVTSVGKDGVTLSKGDEKFVLKLKKEQ